jgi:two-component system chemotaxis sensor kinase CheA
MSEFQVSAELLGIYLEDARSHLEALDHCLLTLEREGLDAGVVSAVLGPLHTLKGNSGMIGFSSIKEYVHKLEDVMARIGEASLELEPSVFDRLFEGAAALRDAVERAAEAQAEVRGLAPEIQSLEALMAPAPAATATAPEPPPSAVAKPAPSGTRTDVAQYVTARSSTVRVDFAQLDNLLNLVGELIIYRTKLEQVGHEMAQELAGRGEAPRQLLEAVQHVSGVCASLQETVMDVRMLPIRHVFERFPRLVRDLSRQQGKEIELILEGEGTRVDKAIIDEIGEPLVHMIRNSVDHGIERPEVREARGKTRTGTILLSASQESNHVLVTIMDDGGGIDADAVRRKAMQRGLLKGDEHLSDRDVIQLIFSQGFSTASSVTEVSGRGVGLEVVLQAIERLNGLVEVESVPKVGTKFIIQLPLTLAIISALLVEVSGQIYALPLSAVVESIKFQTSEIHPINGRDTLRIRDRLVPLLWVSRMFGLPEREALEREYAVILGRGDKRVGLVVDHLRGQQEVVIKALDPAVSGGAFGVAGATIMGDGRVVLILDVATLFEGKRLGLVHGREEARSPVGG